MQQTGGQTLAIIKPDALNQRVAGKIISMIEESGFQIIAMKLKHLTEYEARRFYMVHTGKPFYDGLVEFMSSGPCIALVLSGENILERWRTLMGPTDPSTAPIGTIRRQFGSTIRRNAVHGSDSPESAIVEIGFFFTGIDAGEQLTTLEESSI